MNLYDDFLMDKPSIISDFCAFCGNPRTEYHHIVPRSRGGACGPVVAVCGFGNASGCHGKLHSHELHLDWREGKWVYLRTDEPMKDSRARSMGGWRPVRTWDDIQSL